eukprot:jgi/Mesen1/8574/ME000497S07985
MSTPEEIEAIKNSKVLMVGAGGIGCELLKTLVMTGFKDIELVDLDTIDVSNLNRQFLFRKRHVGQSKAKVAREAVLKLRPDARIVAHHGNVKDALFSVEYIQRFSVVLNGLDNLEARRHVNRLCLAGGVPLVESGTTGYLGQVAVHMKGHTQCYECEPKPAPKTYPTCTITNTPSKPVHCIVWAKELPFAKLFGERGQASDLDRSTDDMSAAEEEEERAFFEMRPGERPDAFTRRVFDRIFGANVARTLEMDDLWKGRRRPTPLYVNAVLGKGKGKLGQEGESGESGDCRGGEAAGRCDETRTDGGAGGGQVPEEAERSANAEAPHVGASVDGGQELRAGTQQAIANGVSVAGPGARAGREGEGAGAAPHQAQQQQDRGSCQVAGAGPTGGCSAMARAGLADPQAVWSVEENARLFLESLKMFVETRQQDIGQLTFDKDDQLAVEFVAAASNLRCASFGIPALSLFDAKGVAGNIVHAIATTNAVIAGLIVLEALKILTRHLDGLRTTYVTEFPSGRGLLIQPCRPDPPNPNCYVCSDTPLLLEVNTLTAKLGQLVEKVVRARLGVSSPFVMHGSSVLETFDEEKEPDGMVLHGQIPPTLADGIGNGEGDNVVDGLKGASGSQGSGKHPPLSLPESRGAEGEDLDRRAAAEEEDVVMVTDPAKISVKSAPGRDETAGTSGQRENDLTGEGAGGKRKRGEEKGVVEEEAKVIKGKRLRGEDGGGSGDGDGAAEPGGSLEVEGIVVL